MKLAAYNSMLEYELVDANGGIQKVRVEPATRSAVATCYTPGRGKIVPRNVNNVNNVNNLAARRKGLQRF